jgi:hypothetical protein
MAIARDGVENGAMIFAEWILVKKGDFAEDEINSVSSAVYKPSVSTR